MKAKRREGAAKPDEVYQEIHSYIAQCGKAPTVEELAHILECGRSTVQRGVAALIAEGRISRPSRSPRGIILPK